jgi:Flp pilus assembly protein TadG
MSTRAVRDDSGMAGGLDGLAFGVLVFVFGTLMVVNAWQVVDAKSAAAAAAREASRAYVEAPSADVAAASAATAAAEAIEGHDRSQARFALSLASGGFARCARVVFEARYRVPLVAVPVIGSFGSGLTVSARHAEVVDPYRSGLPGEAACADA